MPNLKNQTLDVSVFKISWIWDNTVQTIIKMNLNNPVPYSNYQKLKQS